VVAYNVDIHGLCRAGCIDEAIEMRKSMIEKGLVPDCYTYVTLVNGYCREKRLKEAKLILSEMNDVGLKPGLIG
jgi:leucine-rich PPR motif-containing protein